MSIQTPIETPIQTLEREAGACAKESRWGGEYAKHSAEGKLMPRESPRGVGSDGGRLHWYFRQRCSSNDGGRDDDGPTIEVVIFSIARSGPLRPAQALSGVMFASFSGSFSNPFSRASFGLGQSSARTGQIDLAPVKVHDTELDDDQSSRRLRHLLKLNHVNHAILDHQTDSFSYNPTAHFLGCAHILGGNPEKLNEIYDNQASVDFVPWTESPAEVAEPDWRDFLGRPEYQRAFLDFFEDQLVTHNAYEWRAVVAEYLWQDDRGSLLRGVMAGLGKPLIHLGYAYELNSKELAMEALTLAAVATADNPLAGHLNSHGSYAATVEREAQTTDLFHLMAQVHTNKQLDGVSLPIATDGETSASISALLSGSLGPIILSHWAAFSWSPNPQTALSQFSQLQRLALTISSLQPNPNPDHPPPGQGLGPTQHHLLLLSYALRVIIPNLPTSQSQNQPGTASPQQALLRQWLLLALCLYVLYGRPSLPSDPAFTSATATATPSSASGPLPPKADNLYDDDGHQYRADQIIRIRAHITAAGDVWKTKKRME